MILDAAGTASADGRKVVDLLVGFALEQVGYNDAETVSLPLQYFDGLPV